MNILANSTNINFGARLTDTVTEDLKNHQEAEGNDFRTLKKLKANGGDDFVVGINDDKYQVYTAGDKSKIFAQCPRNNHFGVIPCTAESLNNLVSEAIKNYEYAFNNDFDKNEYSRAIDKIFA